MEKHMNIKITTDSTCDLPRDLLVAYDIYVFPLYVMKDGRSYRDGIEICPQDIFDHVAGGGELCSTSAVNLADYMNKFGELTRQYDAVIHINLSAEFSCCHQNARLASAEFPHVHVVDSRNLTCGNGLVALLAAQLAQAGHSPKEILAKLQTAIPQVDVSFILSNLAYLRKGGRCSSVTALGANLLKLKPTIHVTEGKMAVGKKYRGSFEKTIDQFLEEQLADHDAIDPTRVFLGTVGLSPAVIDQVKAKVASLIDFQQVIVYEAGCAITCHCGPGTLGLVFLRKG